MATPFASRPVSASPPARAAPRRWFCARPNRRCWWPRPPVQSPSSAPATSRNPAPPRSPSFPPPPATNCWPGSAKPGAPDKNGTPRSRKRDLGVPQHPSGLIRNRRRAQHGLPNLRLCPIGLRQQALEQNAYVSRLRRKIGCGRLLRQRGGRRGGQAILARLAIKDLQSIVQMRLEVVLHLLKRNRLHSHLNACRTISALAGHHFERSIAWNGRAGCIIAGHGRWIVRYSRQAKHISRRQGALLNSKRKRRTIGRIDPHVERRIDNEDLAGLQELGRIIRRLGLRRG